MSMHILTDRASALLSGQLAQGTGGVIDSRACKDYGYLYISAGKAGAGTGASAILTMRVSHDQTSWVNVYQITAVPGNVYTAHLQGFFPYVQGSAGPCYTATGAAGSATAVSYMHWAPGLV